MKTNSKKIKTIRTVLIVFIVLLVLSGISAFPLVSELDFLYSIKDYFPESMQSWIAKVDNDIHHTPSEMFYGTDWLAFAHLVIAVAFIGPVIDPVRNIWVIQFGIIASLMVIPMALIGGAVRDIPFFHQLIDCSFGVFALIPLYFCYKVAQQLETDQKKNIQFC